LLRDTKSIGDGKLVGEHNPGVLVGMATDSAEYSYCTVLHSGIGKNPARKYRKRGGGIGVISRQSMLLWRLQKLSPGLLDIR
tara:strand:- start:1218 stop:1463 length:246 start_codon:yes stop_codon:yes gene_type:complete